jgi:hypothetical protein
MNKQIEIHEFSTGIVVETKPDGGWFSRGFTGSYMNQTIDPIPDSIQEAISNRLFAIAEGASSDTSSIIGREVGSNDEIWSVVAVVNKARDESRSFSAYRYFCIEGKGNLNKILHFLAKNPLKFNPFDVKTLNNPHLVTDENETKVPLDNFQDLFTDSLPVIVPSDRSCSPIIINRIAEEIAGESLTAWAYNVQAVETPRSFYVIKPSDEKAEEIIRKSLSNQVSLNRPIFEEQKIKTAITTLCKRNKIKVEYIQTIEEALSNPDINNKFWQGIFDGQGLKQAKSQGIYNDEMTRLFTLQALILPDTLPEFLTWAKNIKKEEFLATSNNFQWEILKLFTTQFSSKYLGERIEIGVILIFPYLLKNDHLLEQVIWLLKSEKSLWGYYYINQISKEIDHDLNLMKDFSKQKDVNDNFQLMEEESWIKIRDELTIVWNKDKFKPITKYQVWVTLFDSLKESKFALLFAHFAYYKVPKNIFSQVQSITLGRNFHHQIYGVKVYREVGSFEQFLLNLIKFVNREIDMKLWKIVILITVCGLGGFFSRVYLFPSKLEKSADTFFKNNIKNNQDKSLASLTKPNDAKNKIAEILVDKDNKAKLMASVISCSQLKEECQVNNPANKLIEKASQNNNFKTTAQNITSLINELAKNDSNNEKKYIDNLKKILGNNSLDYTALSDSTKQKEDVKNIWVNAIYIYQAKNIDKGIQPDGIITLGGKTEATLKEELSK